MTFKEIFEAKQIGIIYHFTKEDNILKILKGSEKIKPFTLLSWNNVISCTRNACMSSEIFRNDFKISEGYTVRISLNGNKISEKYKIKPIAGYKNNDENIFNTNKNNLRINRDSGEFEEVVLVKEFNIKKYIKQIDIYYHNEKSKEIFEELQNLGLDFPINLVRKFSIVENINLDEYLEISLP